MPIPLPHWRLRQICTQISHQWSDSSLIHLICIHTKVNKSKTSLGLRFNWVSLYLNLSIVLPHFTVGPVGMLGVDLGSRRARGRPPLPPQPRGSGGHIVSLWWRHKIRGLITKFTLSSRNYTFHLTSTWHLTWRPMYLTCGRSQMVRLMSFSSQQTYVATFRAVLADLLTELTDLSILGPIRIKKNCNIKTHHLSLIKCMHLMHVRYLLQIQVLYYPHKYMHLMCIRYLLWVWLSCYPHNDNKVTCH